MTIKTAISIHELYDIKKKKENKQIYCYEHIIELCFNKIKRIAEHGGLHIYFAVPRMLFGFPLYDFEKCCAHIIKVIKSKGFLVRRLDYPQGDILYITWDINEIKPKKTIKIS